MKCLYAAQGSGWLLPRGHFNFLHYHWILAYWDKATETIVLYLPPQPIANTPLQTWGIDHIDSEDDTATSSIQYILL